MRPKQRATRRLFVGVVALLWLGGGCHRGVANASSAGFDKAMKPILAQYIRAHAALAADGTRGVAKAAKRIATLTRKLDPRAVSGKRQVHFAALPGKLLRAASKLASAKSLAAAREAFKALSRPMVLWATLSKPAGVNVLFCSMAKGSWLQTDKAVRNPYYGKKMLRCGQIIGGAHHGHSSGHMRKK